MIIGKGSALLGDSSMVVNRLFNFLGKRTEKKKITKKPCSKISSSHKKIVIFGNSGAGKTTLAKAYATKYGLVHLDIDTLAWRNTTPPARKAIETSVAEINQFMQENKCWVIEGSYADLLTAVVKESNEMIFLNPDINTCINNCRNKPFEPQKYQSMKAQNENLSTLLHWIKGYSSRKDEFSLYAHQKLFAAFSGKKKEYRSNERTLSF